jgi:riboflavin biosynthesis pyrimidine reductase
MDRLDPLISLFESAAAPPIFDVPDELAQLYGGGIGFDAGAVFANFVESLDGVVALGEQGVSSGPAISGRSEADRFVMGLLRACADAVLIGASTMRDDPGHLWTPGYIYPPQAAAYAELRRRLGKEAEPLLVVASRSGELDTSEPALEGALVLTTDSGRDRLEGRVPPSTRLVSLGTESPDPSQLLAATRVAAGATVLCEGGPHLIGQLIAAGFVRELFLTLSPVVAGRAPGRRRLGLVEGQILLPERRVETTLLSARRHGSHLFLRFALP